MKKGIFIGRFQPMHKGHKSSIESAMDEVNHLIIGLGSAEKHHTPDNPFSCEERKTMLESSLEGNYSIVPIPDINDYSRWVRHVENLAGDFDIVYSGNLVVCELFQKEGYETRQPEEKSYISGSAIREMMAKGDEWKKYVTPQAAEFLEKIDGESRVRALYKQYLNPIPAVDAVIEHEGEIVLIRRSDCSYALPGGFVEFGESTESAAVREVKEETNLDFQIEKLVGVYSEPGRDKRTHVISIAYAGKGYGKIIAGDDAKGITKMKLRDALNMRLAFDHNKILEDYAML